MDTNSEWRTDGMKGRTAVAERLLIFLNYFVAGYDASVQQRSKLDPFLDMMHKSNEKEVSTWS
ncbi:hypothetical protein F2Q70_00029254 [Brassica cretica]|uniref:Uncharacterized protein n=1 Tax=Brassica cretica TaxID=69181 RepID=A0A3N6QZ52_BRACR|nr:hypothetical protein F2Q70_00029254 [Brassica cretica]KAF3593474.1 hypothetical protein DY000_02020627 [Brassica cretica]